MFSRPLILSAVVASASAISFLPFQGLSKDAGKYVPEDKSGYSSIFGAAYSKTINCQQCILGGLEFVATKKEEFIPTPVALASKLAGVCCIPGNYGISSCDITYVDTMKKSTAWAQREIALANCPNVKELCGDTQLIDLDVAEKKVTVGGASVKLTSADSCSYIAKSKCKAPTVDFGALTNKDTDKNIYDISYLEYSMLSVETTTTELTVEVTSSNAKENRTNLLGGDLFPVLWRNDKDVDALVPAEFFASWMSEYSSKYKAYADLVASQSYTDQIDKYNYFAAGKAWTKAWLTKNVDKAVDETVTKPYTDRLRKKEVNGAEILIAPEMPMVPTLPAAYAGPTLHSEKVAQVKNTFKLTGGMGLPTIGKLGFESSSGFGHGFGVKGQGNEI